jgi:hypothetical protein
METGHHLVDDAIGEAQPVDRRRLRPLGLSGGEVALVLALELAARGLDRGGHRDQGLVLARRRQAGDAPAGGPRRHRDRSHFRREIGRRPGGGRGRGVEGGSRGGVRLDRHPSALPTASGLRSSTKSSRRTASS